MVGDRIAHMICERCKKELTGNQKRWCSLRCSKLGLKALYKRRNKDKINGYNRQYRKLGIRTKLNIPEHDLICAKCGSNEGIQQHHIKPRILGGKHKYNIILLCPKHHAELEKLTKKFWYEYY
jgi:5-methylcytosine-specific restriction endonuclease McrA